MNYKNLLVERLSYVKSIYIDYRKYQKALDELEKDVHEKRSKIMDLLEEIRQRGNTQDFLEKNGKGIKEEIIEELSSLKSEIREKSPSSIILHMFNRLSDRNREENRKKDEESLEQLNQLNNLSALVKDEEKNKISDFIQHQKELEECELDFKSKRKELEKFFSRVFRYVVFFPLLLAMAASSIGLIHQDFAHYLLGMLTAKGMLLVFYKLYLLVVLFIGILYSYFAEAKILLSALLFVPVTIVMTMVKWEHQAFIEEYVVTNILGGTSLIAVIIAQSKTLEEKREQQQQLEREERIRKELKIQEEQEQARQAEEAKEAKLAEEAKQAEEARLAKEAKLAEEAKQAEKAERKENQKINYYEALRSQAQMAIQNREFDFRVTLKHRASLLEKVIKFFTDSKKENYSHDRLISEASDILYKTLLYFKSVTLVNSVRSSVESKFSNDKFFSENKLVDMIDEFRSRLDFRRELIEIDHDAQKIKELFIAKTSEVFSEVDLLDLIKLHLHIYGRMKMSDLEYLLHNHTLHKKSNFFKSDLKEIFKSSDEEVSRKISSSLLRLVESKDECRDYIFESMKASLSELRDQELDRLFNDDAQKENKGNNQEEKSIVLPKEIVNQALRSIIKHELDIPDVKYIHFVRLSRTNKTGNDSIRQNSHIYDWLEQRIIRKVEPKGNRKGLFEAGTVKDPKNIEEASESLFVCWVDHYGDINDGIIGVLHVTSDGVIKKRYTRPYTTNNRGQTGLHPITFKSISLPKSLKTELESNGSMAFSESGFVEFLPSVLDAMSRGNKVPFEGKTSIKSILIADNGDQETVSFLVPLYQLVAIGKNSSYLSYLVDRIDEGELFFNYHNDVYRVNDISLHKGAFDYDQSYQEEYFKYDIDFNAIGNKNLELRKDICTSLIMFVLEWSEDDDTEKEKTSPLLGSKLMNLEFGSSVSPTNVIIEDINNEEGYKDLSWYHSLRNVESLSLDLQSLALDNAEVPLTPKMNYEHSALGDDAKIGLSQKSDSINVPTSKANPPSFSSNPSAMNPHQEPLVIHRDLQENIEHEQGTSIVDMNHMTSSQPQLQAGEEFIDEQDTPKS